MKEFLIGLEKSLLDQAVRSDPNKLEELIADDFFEIGSSGQAFGKQEVLAWLPKEGDIQFTAYHVQVKELSETLFLLTYQAKMRGKSKAHSYSMRSSIWQKTDNSWSMIFHQGTPCDAFDN